MQNWVAIDHLIPEAEWFWASLQRFCVPDCCGLAAYDFSAESVAWACGWGTSRPTEGDWRADSPGDARELARALRVAAEVVRGVDAPAVTANLFNDILTPESYADLLLDLANKAAPSGGSDLPIPPALADLIDAGAWPTPTSADAQNLRPLATVAAVSALAPGEQAIFLNPPPFASLASEIAVNPDFWQSHGALSEVDPALALVIGDFGAGSDAAIVLDYRRSRDEPSVMRLAWSAQGNHWVEVAPTFELFAQALQLG
nr:DUF6331 family protein [Tessaracoccus sp. ZS01]